MSDRTSRLQASINAYRARLEALDRAALASLEQAYSPGRESILQTIDALVVEIEQAGPDITPSQAARLGRAKELLRQIEAETTRLAQAAGQVIPAAQQQAISQALQRAESLTVVQAPDAQAAAELARQWTGLNRGALENLVGALSDGSPLNDWLQAVVGETVDEARRVLMDGITRGLNPRAIGRDLARVSGMPLHRAQAAARTMTMDAYRSASLQTMAENDDILAGWQWSAAHQSRTCLACLAKDDGTVYPLAVQFMPSHPQCRCSPIPKLKDDDDMPPIETGQEWFDRQPQDVKDRMVPLGLRDDFRAGRVTLDDMATLQRNPEFGDRWRQSTITEARAAAKARRAGTRRTPTPATPAQTPRPAPIGPTGNPVSSAIDPQLPRSGKNAAQAQAIRDTIADIDQVHGIPEIDGVPLTMTNMKGAYGKYYFNQTRNGAVPHSIKIKADGDHPRMTTAHEIGHYLDQQLFGKRLNSGPQGFASAGRNRAPAMQRWKDAVEQSRAVNDLRAIINSAPGTVRYADKQAVASYLSNSEMFARSYAQYIATRSGSPAWRAELDMLRNKDKDVYYATQWDDDDFEPIAAAFDDLFREVGGVG